MSLRSKLILTHTLVVIMAVSLVSIIANLSLDRYFRSLAETQARDAAGTLAPIFARCYAEEHTWNHALRSCVPRGQLRNQGILGVRRMLIANDKSLVLFDSQDSLLESVLLPQEFEKFSAPIIVDGKRIGIVAVEPNNRNFGPAEQQFLRLMRRTVFLASLGALALALLVSTFFSSGLTRSLRLLTGASYRLAQGDRSAQVPAHQQDEVGELSRAFNTLSSELAHSEHIRRQMVADIAHELRTPLSVMQLELESLEDGVTQFTPDALGSLHEEVDLLNHLIDDLRTLSLADAGQLPLHLESLPVPQIAERIHTRFSGPAREKQITLGLEAAPELPAVRADAARLHQVIGNLMNNALRYTPSGGLITVAIHAAPSEIIFEVRDTGSGFDPVDAAAIFERFYRTDKARTRDTGGSGLGLAIVRGLTQAMGGRVWATSNPAQGSAFFVALPRA